jgi:hypothetical protein
MTLSASDHTLHWRHHVSGSPPRLSSSSCWWPGSSRWPCRDDGTDVYYDDLSLRGNQHVVGDFNGDGSLDVAGAGTDFASVRLNNEALLIDVDTNLDDKTDPLSWPLRLSTTPCVQAG